MTWELRPDQVEDLALFMNHQRFINGNEPGTGKTPVACVRQRWLWDTHQVRTVWVMPMSLMKKNKKEADKFGGWSDPNDVVIVDGNPVEIEKRLGSSAKVFIMGFARFRISQARLPPDMSAIDIDEWHKGFGGHDSATSLALYEFAKRKGKDLWFTPMTGTIINGKLDTVYPALRVIEPRYYGNYKTFCNLHHVVDDFTGKIVGYKNHDRIKMLLSHHGTNRKWGDIHGAEDKVIQPQIIEMTAPQRALYDKFEKEALLELDNFFVDGRLPGAAFIRALQIMDHPNKFPDLRFDAKKRGMVDIMPGVRNGKIEALDLHLTDHLANGTPLLIYAGLIPQQIEIFELATKIGVKTGLITGSVSTEDRAAQDEMYCAGKLQCLVVSPEVADVGFNWQFWGPDGVETDHIIFASIPFRDTTFFQAYRRAVRQKRKNTLRITTMKYRKSLDFRKAFIVNAKSREANLVDPAREVFNL